MGYYKKLTFIFILSLILNLNVTAKSQQGNADEKYEIISASNMQGDSQSESGSTELSGFDFIKSDKISNSIFEHEEILLYGGIFLIAVAVIGVVFTIMPRNKKRNGRNKKRGARH